VMIIAVFALPHYRK